ncbi:MAG TPA: hypothetical protein VK800_02440 [Steroidobacteraceae bacterium]|nr:hypothetical protein [Steroidobacteraceae bacterium]
MKPHPVLLRRLSPWAVLCAALGLPAVGSADADTPATVPQSALHACAIIAAASERLSCYDRLSGRAAQSATAAAPPPAAPAAPPAAVQASSAAAAPPTAVQTSPAAAAPPAAAGAAAVPPKESFGLYAAEHPPPRVASSLQARVVALGNSASGRMTVALEGGQLWELDDADPLLAVGETVSIHRAALGSFLMQTATKRTHRVHRLL